MRVLVTGATGFVGQHLTRLLREQGEEVIDWHFSGSPEDPGVVLDLTDAYAVARQDLTSLDAVVHLAGLAEVSRSFSEPAAYVSTNATMEINLFEALLEQESFPQVLIISTGGVYASTEQVITEESSVDSSNPYVVSKLTQESVAAYYAKRGFDTIIARPFNHIGPGQQPGYLIADACSQIAALERRGGGALKVGNLASARDYTDVRDVATAYCELITSGHPGETYNVCTGVSHTGQEMIDRLVGLAEVDITLQQDTALARPTDNLMVRASSQKLREHTSWTPEIPLERTLADALGWWRSIVDPGPVS